MSGKTVAIVLARGGSKGIPRKNMIEFCGKPLIWWTLSRLTSMGSGIDEVFVSSDDSEIREYSLGQGCRIIHRPDCFATDETSSELAWQHALNVVCDVVDVGLVVAPQVTSPIRDTFDFQRAIKQFWAHNYDSMFSATPARDLCLWSESEREGPLICQSYNPKNAERRRQTTFAGKRWIENGSFYLFLPEVLLRTGLRFGERVGVYSMPLWKGLEIDDPFDVTMLEVLMEAHLKGELINQ